MLNTLIFFLFVNEKYPYEHLCFHDQLKNETALKSCLALTFAYLILG